MRIKAATAITAGLVLMLAGCGDGLVGDTKVGDSQHGIWKAPEAKPGCRWQMRTTKGVTIRSGTYTKGAKPTMVIGPKDNGRVFSTGIKCGKWTKK